MKRRWPTNDNVVDDAGSSGIWPTGADDSFFNDAHIELPLEQSQSVDVANKTINRNKITEDHSSGPSNQRQTNIDEQATKLPTTQSTDIDINNTLFANINLDNLVRNAFEQGRAQIDNKSELNIYTEDISYNPLNEDIISNSQQQFLSDMHFKKPQKPSSKIGRNYYDSFICNKNDISDGSFANLSVSIDSGKITGSQYLTREKIQSEKRSIRNFLQHTEYQQDLNNLSSLNWESQIFEENLIPKGDFYGLPNKVRDIIFEFKGIRNLYEWQEECLQLPAIRQRKNLIYALPTSGGKTLVAEILMLREVICREKDVLFILPYVSIVQEKVSAMSPFAIAFEFIVDEYTAGRGKCPPVKRRKRRSVYISSIEKGSILLDSLIEANRANEIGLVVIDELHLIGERGRGGTLESMLTKIMYINANIQIIGMSATIGNLSEISQFLNADVYTRGFRPVELTEYIKCGSDLLKINVNGKSLEDTFIYDRTVNYKYSDAVLRADPDHLAGLVNECAPNNGCLVFCPTRKSCENVALLLCRLLPRSRFFEYRKNEKKELLDMMERVFGVVSPILIRTIPFGIIYHHSGLTTDERKFLEQAYRSGIISVICCTSTLAAGVNLPAKRVIIRAPYVGNEFISLSRYKQMVGRAGRTGFGESGESILITSSSDNARVGKMLCSPMDKTISSMATKDYVGLQTLILSAIGLGLASTRSDVMNLMERTLLQVQNGDLNISIDTIVTDILQDMFRHKILEVKLITDRERNDRTGVIIKTQYGHQTTSQRRVMFVGRDSRFQLTRIGRAAFKAGIDYNRAYLVYKELNNSLKHLMLRNNLHLLYLIVCFNSNTNGDDFFAADAGILFKMYEEADENTQLFFKLLDFTEAYAAKMMKTMSIQGPLERRLNRIYKVLILNDMLSSLPLHQVALKYKVERGALQNFWNQSVSSANAIVRLCEEIDDFWCLRSLFDHICKKLDRSSIKELEPLLNLPSVQISRAKQLYSAGFKTMEDIAKAEPSELVKSIPYMSLRIAKEIISAAKIFFIKRLNDHEDEIETLKQYFTQPEVMN